METSNVSLTIGDYELKPILTGEFGLDGGAMFGTVPKTLWEKSNPPDSQNRIKMEARALLLKSRNNKKNILIDTGNGGDFIEKYGEKMGRKFAEIYNVGGPSQPSLLKSLKAHGLSPDDITEVILTHLHFDHAGGSTKSFNGHIVPTFPHAKYYVQRENLKTAQNPNIRERASYLKPNFEPLLDANVLNLLDGPQKNLLPYIDIELSFGHTCAQQIIKISDSNLGLYYTADLIPTSSHIRTAWIMGYDLDPLRIIAEKRKLLANAVQNNHYIYFEHDPYCDLALIEVEKDDFRPKTRLRLL